MGRDLMKFRGFYKNYGYGLDGGKFWNLIFWMKYDILIVVFWMEEFLQ